MSLGHSDYKRTLICFTASFPFGKKETFFENELPYLARAFDTVHIFPLYNPSGSSSRRSVASNVRVYEPFVSSSKVIRILQGILNLSPFLDYLSEFFTYQVYNSRSKALRWFNSLLNFRRSYACFKRYSKSIGLNNDTVLYSYWAEAPIFLTRLVEHNYKVVRMHRIDFYLNINENYLPLRHKIYSKSSLLLPISEDITRLLITYYKVNPQKIFLNRLGVSGSGSAQPYIEENLIRIVSCSRVDPVKRVHLIAEALKEYNGEILIQWHHFGDGKVFNDLKARVSSIKSNVKVVLHGWTDQSVLNDFYKNTPVTWFVNVSESEGIPVSIMEAMSHGIPVIATDVGATSEIVSNDNGVLISSDFEISELLELIVSKPSDYFSKRIHAFETWRIKYNADSNYSQLTDLLRELI